MDEVGQPACHLHRCLKVGLRGLGSYYLVTSIGLEPSSKWRTSLAVFESEHVTISQLALRKLALANELLPAVCGALVL